MDKDLTMAMHVAPARPLTTGFNSKVWNQSARRLALASATVMGLMPGAQATTALADQPIFSSTSVPGNLALALSVEFPTAVSVAHVGNTYDPTRTYQGYFDPNKCYLYVYDASEPLRHFTPSGAAIDRACTGAQDSKWSGNFMNWATMQTIDPFRWALTGGYRSTDTATETIIEKAWASGQGGTNNFPNRSLDTSALVGDNTPFNTWSNFDMRVQGLGNQMRFTQTGNLAAAATAYIPSDGVSPGTVYTVSVRVKVCDTNAANGPLERNCTAYPNGNYKPTGLIQKYAERIRYSAFGYLNDSNKQRDGGVLRAQQKFVGPTYTLPTQSQTTNSANEWDANTGVYTLNPDTSDATATATLFGVPVANSGVINYLNKFGQITPGTYKSYDNVSELYYAAIRYFKNLGNVTEWTSRNGANTATKTTWVDGFPVIENWNDPILYSCQKNFVLGIGDVNTWTDKNVPGNTGTTGEPSKPSAVVADTSVDAKVATDKVGSLHGLGANLGSATNNQEIPGSYYIAGLAYDSNTKDIRPDVVGQANTLGKQTIQTYWLDVLEYSNYKNNNQFYLATKYGGFKVPEGFDPYTRSTDIPVNWWSSTGEILYGQTKPDNYFVASNPDNMIDGLTKAFAGIAASMRAYSTGSATASPHLAASGVASYSAQFDASTWTGELTASTVTFDANGVPTMSEAWKFSDKLAAQASGTGWNTARRIVTWNTATSAAVPFRIGSIGANQATALDTIYRTGDDKADYLNYLRGDKTHEENSGATGSAKIYRNRDKLLGDIVNSRPRVVAAPSLPFSDSANPGYSTFRSTWSARPTMVYVGSNAGMLHAVNGSTTGTNAGREVFAYVPGGLMEGPTGSPSTTGLAARGDPDFTHRYFVDAPIWTLDVDMGKTVGGSGTNWRSILVGGLGKGGKSYYALDITDPGGIDLTTTAVTTETNVATRVLWEFSHADLGYTYGEPAIVKTKKHGWVVIFGSGYNNTDGRGYFFFVNPRTGALLEKIEAKTSLGPVVGSPTNQAGLAQVQAFVLDRTDGTADAVYAGDLLGNVWRLDVRAASGSYPAPTLLATLRDSNSAPQPVTTRPMVVTQPLTNKRWVTVGTGRLLADSDVSNTQTQTMYAIMDGTGMAFADPAPTGFTYPVGRSNLKQLTDLTAKVTLDLSTQLGWYTDLGTGTGGMGWRVVNHPSAFYGVLEFTTMLPNGEVCSPSGTSRAYAIDLGTGQSNLLADSVDPNSTARKAFHTVAAGVATEQRSVSVTRPNNPLDTSAGQNAKRTLQVCNSEGGCETLRTAPPGAMSSRRLNWRELPLAN